jgi:thiol-disulfide isomerase/thioredoxin
VLAGKPVPITNTRTFGCSTKWSDKRAEAEASIAKWNQEAVGLEPLGEQALQELVSNKTEDLLVINIWATWCAPCIAELPEFVTMNRMYRNRNFRFVTISIDEPDQKENALKVLKRVYASNTNYIVDIENRDRFADLLDKEWEGPVPYTLIIAPGGEVIYRKASSIDPLEVRRAIVDVLGRTYASRKKK